MPPKGEHVATADEDVKDQQALDLRVSGRSFSRIATQLGFERASHAVEAFNRALRRTPEPERARLRDNELARLDRLADRVKQDAGGDATTGARALQAIAGLRKRLLAP